MTEKRSVVQKIYENNWKISDLELADEIIEHEELEVIDLWLLPQYPFDAWRRKYDYPKLLKAIKSNRPDFQTWMDEQKIDDGLILKGYLTDFLENKPLANDKKRFLINVSYKGKVTQQSWHQYAGEESLVQGDETVLYEFVREYVSYYDWKLLKGGKENFIDSFERTNQNTSKENVYIFYNTPLLKMGGIKPPINGFGTLLRGKKLDFVNVSGLELKDMSYYGSMGDLSFEHCSVDNLKCNEIDLPHIHFTNCSIRNIQIRNSNIESWLFASCKTTGNIIDSSLSYIRIYGGRFNPAFTNCEFGKILVQHEGVAPEEDFDKTYRTFAKAAKESGNNDLYSDLKIKEYDFIREKAKGVRKVLKTVDKYYWGYGYKPKRLVFVTLISIVLFGFIYSFFPNEFNNEVFKDRSYFEVLFNTQYYSVVTFTTLGYGDISPTGFVKIFAAFEAIFGALTMGFLVAGLAKSE